MSNEITTSDLSKFGFRERVLVEELLKAWREQGLPNDFYENEVTIMMNMGSGNVFLTNSDCQVAMLNGDKLESFYYCSNCGHEGFKEEMTHNADDVDCKEYLQQIGVIEETEE